MENRGLILYVSIFLYQLSCIACQESVRLVGGGSAYEGQVEVLICTSSTNCAWNNVCTNGWSRDEAIVTCRQFGLDGQNASPPGPARPSFKSPPSSSSRSATIEWSGTSAIKYHISCSNGYHSYAHPNQSLTLQNLSPFTTYQCCVLGIDSDNIMGSEDCTTFQTLIGTLAPVGLRYTALQSQSVTLHWEQIPNITLYKIKVNGCNYHNSEQDTRNTYTTITSLCPYSMYNVSVKACPNDSTCGSFSPEIQLETLEDAPSTVNNLLCTAISPTQVNVVWQPPLQPNGVIRHYEITLSNINTTVPQNSTKFVDSNMMYATIDHLHPNHQYSCSVAAHTVVKGISAITQSDLLYILQLLLQ